MGISIRQVIRVLWIILDSTRCTTTNMSLIAVWHKRVLHCLAGFIVLGYDPLSASLIATFTPSLSYNGWPYLAPNISNDASLFSKYLFNTSLLSYSYCNNMYYICTIILKNVLFFEYTVYVTLFQYNHVLLKSYCCM